MFYLISSNVNVTKGVIQSAILHTVFRNHSFFELHLSPLTAKNGWNGLSTQLMVDVRYAPRASSASNLSFTYVAFSY